MMMKDILPMSNPMMSNDDAAEYIHEFVILMYGDGARALNTVRSCFLLGPTLNDPSIQSPNQPVNQPMNEPINRSIKPIKKSMLMGLSIV